MANIDWTPSQRSAIDAKGCSLAVSAAAGSGKTAVLTQRIIEKLKNGGDISRLLVVTYTNDAASDLREKIRAALSASLIEDPDSPALSRQLIKLSGARISTISSFCLSVVKANFQLSGLPSDFSVLSDTQDILLRKNVADELISDFFFGRVSKEEANIADFSAFADTFGKPGNDEALADAVSRIYEKLSSTARFIETLKDRIDDLSAEGVDFAKTKFGAWVLSYVDKMCAHYIPIFDAAAAYATAHDEVAGYASAFEDDSDFLEDVRRAIASGKGYEEIRAVFTAHKFAKLGAAARGYVQTAEVAFFREARDEFKKEYKKICSDVFIFGADSVEDGRKMLLAAISDLYEFMKLYKRRLDAQKRMRHAISFSDIEHKALALMVGEDGLPTSIALAMQNDFDEIYIDEYQDTNEVEDRIFCALAKENNRFVVGDIKQCIYAFRSADPSIFERLIETSEKYCEECESPKQKVFLSQNFRSTDEILDFSNAVFELQMQRGGIMAYGADERLYGTGKHADRVHVAVCLKEKGEDTEPEAEYVSSKISELLASGKKRDGSSIQPSDIVIILRSVKHRADVFKKHLEKRGVPCEDLATEAFFESPEVLLVVSLLNVIDNPTRDIYLAATLKSPLYGVTLEELVYIRRYSKEGTLFDALRKFTDEKGFAKGEKFLADYERYREYARTKPCDELIWQIYLEKEILSLVIVSDDNAQREAARANLLQLYNYARSFVGSAFRGVYDFLSFISDVIANGTKIDIPGSTASANAVRIITSHQSKGLEYPVCFVSACGAELNKKDAFEDTVIDKELGIVPKIALNYGLKRVNIPQRAAASFKIAHSACEEELRVLYVALTRAKEKLFVTGEVSGKILENKERYCLLSSYGTPYFALKERFFSPYEALTSGNYLEMILPAVVGRNDICTSEIYTHTDDTVSAPSCNEDAESDTDISYYAAKKLIEERFSFAYPNSALSEVPSKLSVSRLYPDILDEQDASAELEKTDDEAVPVPAFMLSEDEAVGAKRGNATHLFMQFFDFDSVEKLGIEGEIARLLENKFIFPGDAALINRWALSRFFESELSLKMRKSTRIYREKRFIINYPAENFTLDAENKKALSGEKLLVQGIIDCAFFDEKGELILVDYKTDFFPREMPREEVECILKERHERQIGYYKYACREMFGTECAHAYIYSFSLNKTIEI